MDAETRLILESLRRIENLLDKILLELECR